MKFSFILVLLLYGFSCSQRNSGSAISEEERQKIDCKPLDSLYEKLEEPKPGEWLYEHEEEDQSLSAYIKDSPRRPNEKRKIIYIQPIGNFDTVSNKIIDKVSNHFHAFFGLEVKVNSALPDSVIPEKARRIHYDAEQWQTKWILHELLRPMMPKDAFVMIALTDHDLFPDEKWNFVFGQASLKHGVGVWSYYRFGSPYLPESAILEFNKRVIRTAAHETGHMFSIPHCVVYKCLMNGSNSLEEADHKPLYLCPRCLEKLCWNLGMDPKEHLLRMEKFWKDEKVFFTSHFYSRCLRAFEKK